LSHCLPIIEWLQQTGYMIELLVVASERIQKIDMTSSSLIPTSQSNCDSIVPMYCRYELPIPQTFTAIVIGVLKICINLLNLTASSQAPPKPCLPSARLTCASSSPQTSSTPRPTPVISPCSNLFPIPICMRRMRFGRC